MLRSHRAVAIKATHAQQLCMRGLSLAHSNEAATPVLLSRELLPANCTGSYSRCVPPSATLELCSPWAPVAGRGRHRALTPTDEVRIVVLPECWARRLVDNPASTVVERTQVQARVWKRHQCPLRAQTQISFSVPSVDSVAPPCRGSAAVVDCGPRRGVNHLGTVLSASRPACRTSKVGAG